MGLKMIYSMISQKGCGRIRMKLGGQVGCVTPIKQFDFGEDPNPDLDTIIILFFK